MAGKLVVEGRKLGEGDIDGSLELLGEEARTEAAVEVPGFVGLFAGISTGPRSMRTTRKPTRATPR